MGQEELANRLHSVAIHLLRRVARIDAASGLSPARLSALSIIVYGGPTTMTALAAAEGVTPATVTSTVTGLESAGLVRRSRLGVDARQVTVAATDAGSALMNASRARRIEIISADLTGLSTVEREALEIATQALERMLRRNSAETYS